MGLGLFVNWRDHQCPASAPTALKVECLESRVLLSADPFLEASGTVIRDGHGTGDPVLLQGTNLGGWLVTEGWMTPRDSSGLPDDYSARQTLIDRFGEATADSLTNTYEDAWVTTQDLDNIKALGMNVIRLPFWYRNLENEDGTWRADAFDRMDWLVTNAWARGIYTILDFHGVVGGQSTAEHTGRVRPTAEFWSSPRDQQRTADIWQRIATHFQGNPGVAGYDLINEPIGAPSQTALWNMYDQLYQTIRSVDPDHMVIMEGTWNQWGWDMLPNPATFGWTNVVYEMHEYQWGFTNDPNGVKAGIDHQVNDFRAHQFWNVPCYIGEFNEFSPGSDPTAVWQYAVQQFQTNNMSWTEWSYKSTSGSGSNSWGIYNRIKTPPPVPNLQTDSAATIASDWAAWITDNAFAVNPMLEAALSLTYGSTLPVGFSDQDVNAPGKVGGAAYEPASSTWLVWGSGSDIWGNADQFNYAAKPVRRVQTITAEITSLANTDPWAKAGVMFRDSWDAGAMFADVLATESNGVAFQWRSSTGGSCGSIQVGGIPAPTPANPLWVELVKFGNTFSAYYSTDGSSWEQVGSGQNISFENSTYLAGLAVTAHNNAALNTATFADVNLGAWGSFRLSGTYPLIPIGSAAAADLNAGMTSGLVQPFPIDTPPPSGAVQPIVVWPPAVCSAAEMLSDSTDWPDGQGSLAQFPFCRLLYIPARGAEAVRRAGGA
jgi:aryl-phospho-beta-D-glucosidase BglC (GH1 family)